MPSPGNKDEHKGKIIYHENLSSYLRISVYPMRVSHILNTCTESLSQQHGGGTRRRKILRHTESRLLNFSNKRSLEKMPWVQGSNLSHACKKSTNHECARAECFSWTWDIFLFKWAIIITSKVLLIFVLIPSKLSTYKNILAGYQKLTACCAEPWKDSKTFRRQG